MAIVTDKSIFITLLFIVQGECCMSEWFERSSDEVTALRANQGIPSVVAQDAVWQPVANTKQKFYVYSAYVDRRKLYGVRVIAATHTYTPDAVWCHIWLRSQRTVTIKASIKVIEDHNYLEFTAAFVLCPLRGSGVSADEAAGSTVAVIVSKNPHIPTTNHLLILDTKPQKNISENLHVCVKPIFKYSRTEWLLEWLEMNRLLGVTHFYMYNESVSDRLACLLNHYEKQSLITLKQWDLPMKSNVDINGNGVLAAFNDCLYRSMSYAEWLLIIDVDEIVIPRYERTVTELLKSLSGEYVTNKPVAFNFTNAFFYVFWEDDPHAFSPLVTSRKTQRLQTNDGKNKIAVRPEKVIEIGKNTVWEAMPNAVSVMVSTDRAVMHHYRVDCENFVETDCHEKPSVVDRTAHAWTDELWKIINTRHNEIQCF